MVLLTDLADVLRTTGRPVIEMRGWKINYHSGAFDPQGNLWHHTGSYDAMADAANDLDYAKWLAFTGRADLAAPLCNVSISAEGVYYVCSAGRAYHAGDAKASGPVPSGNGNGLYIGWECMNSGSQGWGDAQYGAMVDGAVATSKHYRWSAEANRAHKETSLTGKWDPGQLSMDKFRTDIKKAMNSERDWFDMASKKELAEVVNAAKDEILTELGNYRKNELKRDRDETKVATRRHQRIKKILAGTNADVDAVLAALDDEEGSA